VREKRGGEGKRRSAAVDGRARALPPPQYESVRSRQRTSCCRSRGGVVLFTLRVGSANSPLERHKKCSDSVCVV